MTCTEPFKQYFKKSLIDSSQGDSKRHSWEVKTICSAICNLGDVRSSSQRANIFGEQVVQTVTIVTVTNTKLYVSEWSTHGGLIRLLLLSTRTKFSSSWLIHWGSRKKTRCIFGDVVTRGIGQNFWGAADAAKVPIHTHADLWLTYSIFRMATCTSNFFV